MKRETKQMIFIYLLVFIIIILLIILTKIVLDANKKPSPKEEPVQIEEKETSPYPEINNECIFNISYSEYHQLTVAGCQNGYTRYDINNITLDGNNLKVSIIYSDKTQEKTGLFINDVKMISTIDDISKIKFGIFDNKLFIYDKTGNNTNALAFNKNGKEVYNLRKVLEENEIKDLSTGDTNIKTNLLDSNSFIFTEGSIEFNSFSNNCQNGEKSKGSHYKVVYKDEKFELPEFMNLINCE